MSLKFNGKTKKPPGIRSRRKNERESERVKIFSHIEESENIIKTQLKERRERERE